MVPAPTAPLNGNDEGDCVSCFIDEFFACYAELSEFPNLKPCAKVNKAFKKLVGLCNQCPGENVVTKVLSDPKIVAISPHLRQLCSEGEYELESQWAEKVYRCKTLKEETKTEEKGHIANEMLQTFPYYSNYIDLVRMELNALASVAPNFSLRTFAILGSGPLPLTSICISQQLDSAHDSITCHNVDQDALAISSSKKACRALGLTGSKMSFQCADAGSTDMDLSTFDVVYLAALVGGSSKHKQRILADIVKRMRPGGLVVLRSAHSLRRLLYPVVEVGKEMEAVGLKVLMVVHPYNHVINSVVIAAAVETLCACCP